MFRKGFKLPLRLAGIPLYADVSFLIILPLMVWMASGFFTAAVGAATPAALGLGLVAVTGLFASVILHELGHCLTAIRYGVKVRRITLWFLGGVAEFEEMLKQRGAEAVVGIAGPLVSFALAGLFYGLSFVIPPNQFVLHGLNEFLFEVNLMLGLFNLLPALPLDGGRILRSLLAMRLPHVRATVISGRIANVVAAGMVVFAFVPPTNFWLIIMAFFIFSAAKGEVSYAVITDLLKGLTVADLMNRDVRTVPAGTPAGLLAAQPHNGFPPAFRVVDEVGRFLGTAGPEELRTAHPDAPVWQVMTARVPTIPAAANALDAFAAITQSGAPRLIATDAAGTMVGLLGEADLARAVRARTAGYQVAGGPPTPVTVQRVPATPFSAYPPVGYTPPNASGDPQRHARSL